MGNWKTYFDKNGDTFKQIYLKTVKTASLF
jgi:hypothetical protein